MPITITLPILVDLPRFISSRVFSLCRCPRASLPGWIPPFWGFPATEPLCPLATPRPLPSPSAPPAINRFPPGFYSPPPRSLHLFHTEIFNFLGDFFPFRAPKAAASLSPAPPPQPGRIPKFPRGTPELGCREYSGCEHYFRGAGLWEPTPPQEERLSHPG